MIAFACAIVEPDDYALRAGPGIARAAEPDSEVVLLAATGPVCRSRNLLLERAARLDDLEALVIVDEHTEIAGDGFCDRVRAALADPEVGLVGCAGAAGVEGAGWWAAAVSCGGVRHRYGEHGGGELEAYAWARPAAPPAPVDAVDGGLMVLSPWAARTLRFDEGLPLGLGSEVDFAARVRQAGRRVVTADLPVVLHRSLELVPDPEVWIEAHVDLAEKWDGRLPGAPPRPADWKRRARLAEAERDAARARAFSAFSQLEARLRPLEQELTAMTDTVGWRLTAPLRRLNARRARGGSRRAR